MAVVPVKGAPALHLDSAARYMDTVVRRLIIVPLPTVNIPTDSGSYHAYLDFVTADVNFQLSFSLNPGQHYYNVSSIITHSLDLTPNLAPSRRTTKSTMTS